MLFLLAGTNFEARKSASDKLIKTLIEKRPNANQVYFNDQNFSASRFLENIESAGLFEDKNIVVSRGVLEHKEHKDIIISKLKELQDSNNAFIFVENKILKTLSTKFEKVGSINHIYDTTNKNKPSFNIFSLTDLLAQKKKGELWSKYHEAIFFGSSDEELFGIFLWQLKALSAAQMHNLENSGLKPFVYKKSKSSLKNWKENEINNSLKKLVKDYHEARRGSISISRSIEVFILSL